MTAEPQEITTRDVVLSLDRKVDQLVADMADVKVIAGTVGSNVATLIDHEHRIRQLEKFRYGIPSAALILMAFTVLIALAALVYSVFGHHS
jgi:hypothetical protein